MHPSILALAFASALAAPAAPAAIAKAPITPRAAATALLADATHDVQDGNLAAATAGLTRCIQVDPTLAACHRALGIAYGRQGDAARAAAAYRGYLKVAPTAADADHIRDLVAAYEGR